MGQTAPPPPFTCTYSPNVPELLGGLGISLALSTYQAGKVVLLSAKDNETLVQLPRSFDTAMGLAVAPGRLAVAAKDEVLVLGASDRLAAGYPGHPGAYDVLYAPRATYHTGQLSLHDMAWTGEGLLAVNTLFSCLALIDDTHSFRPVWRPPFITRLAPEDRCHLNGMALGPEGRPEYVTALGLADTRQGWREDKMGGGAILRVPSGDVVLGGLPMPHSPRLYDGRLYALLSASGELIRVDAAAGAHETLLELPGFARGMDRHGDYLFIGLSKLRHKTSVFGDLPIARRSPFAGIVIVYLPRPAIVGHIRYEASVEEIYDVKVLPGVRRPGIMNTRKETYRAALVTPTDAFWAHDPPPDSPLAGQKKKAEPGAGAGGRTALRDTRDRGGMTLGFVPVAGLALEEWERRWPDLLFPHFLKRMRRQRPDGELVGVVACEGKEPCALIAGLTRPDEGSAEVMSLVVAPGRRRQGLGSALLAHAGELLRGRGVRHLDAVWHSDWEAAPAIESLLKGDGWLPPQRRMVMHRCSLGFPWINRDDPLPPGYELFPWSQLRPAEAEDLRARERRGEFTSFLTPFQREDLLEAGISRGIRRDGRVVGWLIIHAQARESVQCSCLYVDPGHRHPRLALAMIAAAARALRATGKTRFAYQVEVGNGRVIAFLRRRFAPHGALLAESWIMASRKDLA